MRDMNKIHSSIDHPEGRLLSAYKSVAPIGLWVGRLDHLAWGQSSNLFCYFTNVANDQPVRLAVFSNNLYRPYNSKAKWGFDTPSLLGQHFKISTGVSRSNWPTFLTAKKCAAPKAAC